MSELILGVSGLRGIVGESLTPEVAVRYAHNFGVWLRDREGEPVRVGVASDGRAGWELVHAAAVLGLLSAGCHVFDLGVLTTPTVGSAVDAHALDGAVQVTASHNPQEWNGLKCLVCPRTSDEQREAARTLSTSSYIDWLNKHGHTESPGARAPFFGEARDILVQFSKSSGQVVVSLGGTLSREIDAVQDHIDYVETMAFGGPFQGLAYPMGNARVVVDSVNASGSRLVGLFAERNEIDLIQIAGSGSGIFPHTPEPTAENLSGEGGLCDAVPGLKADVGFAQDPDGDRLAIVDERGRYIGEEYTLVIAAEALLGAMGAGAEGAVLVTNLSTSRMIEDVAKSYGARVERTAVGEANVVERMKALRAAGENVVLGGEGNGGVIWPEVTYVRDSLGAMALTLGVMAREGKSVSELVEMIDAKSAGGKGYAIVKRKQPLARKEDATPAVERIAQKYASERVDTQDGVRVDFTGAREGRWVHVRASNTEPILRLIAEAGSDREAGEVLDEVAGIVDG